LSDVTTICVADGVGLIQIDRPERRNALNLAIKRELATEISLLEANRKISVIILTGGNKYFVAGTDIAEMSDMTSEDHARLNTNSVFVRLRSCTKPLIAAVEGYALGGGFELAMTCDMVIAGENAKFGQPEIRVGIMPGAGGTQAMSRAAGVQRTIKYLLTGEMFGAKEAMSIGVISEIVPDGTATDRAIALARTIASMPRQAVRSIKRCARNAESQPLDAALAQEREAFVALFGTPDQREGMAAFLEKRTPRFNEH
jgi:enoyl-CoA hydratase